MADSQAVDDPASTSDDAADSGGLAGEAPQVDDLQRFDAFDASTWNLITPTVPWHRTRQTMVTAVAAGLAAATLVVSGVLLAFRGGSGSVEVPQVESSSTAISIASGASNVATVTAAKPPPAVPVPAPPPKSIPATPTNVPVIGPPNNRPQPQESPKPRVRRTPAKPRPIGITVKATPAPAPAP